MRSSQKFFNVNNKEILYRLKKNLYEPNQAQDEWYKNLTYSGMRMTTHKHLKIIFSTSDGLKKI